MEWYVEICVRFSRLMPVQTDAYTRRMEHFEGLLSAYLGGPFEPSMLGFVDRLETYAYVEAQSPEEAAKLALRPFGEAAEAAWGPGTTAEVLRILTAEERDRELERGDVAGDVPEGAWLAERLEEGEPEAGRGRGPDGQDPILSLADDPFDDESLPADASGNLDRYLHEYRSEEYGGLPARELAISDEALIDEIGQRSATYLGLSYEAFVEAYRAGTLPDTGPVSELVILQRLVEDDALPREEERR